jgi:hypothetical protein
MGARSRCFCILLYPRDTCVYYKSTTIDVEGVRECRCGCFSKCFSLRKVCQQYFCYFLKIIFKINISK